MQPTTGIRLREWNQLTGPETSGQQQHDQIIRCHGEQSDRAAMSTHKLGFQAVNLFSCSFTKQNTAAAPDPVVCGVAQQNATRTRLRLLLSAALVTVDGFPARNRLYTTSSHQWNLWPVADSWKWALPLAPPFGSTSPYFHPFSVGHTSRKKNKQTKRRSFTVVDENPRRGFDYPISDRIEGPPLELRSSTVATTSQSSSSTVKWQMTIKLTVGSPIGMSLIW